MKARKIIVIDDEIMICKGLSKMIESMGFNVEVFYAVSVLEAENIIEKEKIDIIFTDIFMPQCDGFDVIQHYCHRVKNMVVISGYNEFDYVKRALKGGVSDYLLKPVDSKELFNVLKKILEEANEKNYITAEKGKEDRLLSFLSSSHFKKENVNENIHSIIEFIQKHPRHDYNFTQLANCLDYNYFYFSRKFKEIVGETFEKVLNKAVMSNAKYLLVNTDYSITKISEILGFNNVKYFRTAFKKFYNGSPQEMRKGKY